MKHHCDTVAQSKQYLPLQVFSSLFREYYSEGEQHKLPHRKYSRQEAKHLQLHGSTSIHITDVYYRLNTVYGLRYTSVPTYKHIFEAV